MKKKDNLEFYPFCLYEGTKDEVLTADFIEALCVANNSNILNVSIKYNCPTRDAITSLNTIEIIPALIRSTPVSEVNSITLRGVFDNKYICMIFVEGVVSVCAPTMTEEAIEEMVEALCTAALALSEAKNETPIGFNESYKDNSDSCDNEDQDKN